MSTDPQLTPWPKGDVSLGSAELPSSPPQIPHLGHATLFLVLVGFSFAVVWICVGVGVGMHLFGQLSLPALQKNTYVLIGMMAAIYGIALSLTNLVLPLFWNRSFSEGVFWNGIIAKKNLWVLVAIGIGSSLLVDIVSNFLPIPKSLPIDDFFKTPGSIWTVTFFGVLIAPAFEELAFRGFLLPALANAWDWTATRLTKRAPLPVDINGQPQWSYGAMISSALVTSVGFAIIHAEQLAHSLAPLAVLYCVSLILCTIRFRMRSLAASALVHAAYNLTLFATLFIGTDGYRHLEKIQS